MSSEQHSPLLHIIIHDAQMQEYILLRHVRLLSRHIGTNDKQLVPGQGASSIQPGLPHPENQQLPTRRLFINHALWSYHADLAHGSTSHSVRAWCRVGGEGRIQKVETKTKFNWMI